MTTASRERGEVIITVGKELTPRDTFRQWPFLIEIYDGESHDRSIHYIKERLVPIHQRAFGTGRRQTLRELNSVIQPGGITLIAKREDSDEPGGDVGYSEQHLMLPDSLRFLYLVRGIEPMNRRHQLGVTFVELGVLLEDPFAIVSRTRNPGSILSIKKLSEIGAILPLDLTYDKSPVIQGGLREVIRNLGHNPDSQDIDLKTGLWKHAYEEGRDRSYVPDPTHKEAMALYQRWIEEFKMEPEVDGIVHTIIRRNRLLQILLNN